jgi:hypothetical protein
MSSKVNWIAPIVCIALTLYMIRPFSYPTILGGIAVTCGVGAIVFIVPVTASVASVKYTGLRNWGLIFILGWIAGNLILGALIMTFFIGNH